MVKFCYGAWIHHKYNATIDSMRLNKYGGVKPVLYLFKEVSL
ncbi:hypothetical protein ACQKGI_19400 [Peribacillus muralis]